MPLNAKILLCGPLSFILPPLQTSKNQIKVDLVDENFTELKGEIAGPPDTPYEGEALIYTHSSVTDGYFSEGLTNELFQVVFRNPC